jgi:hypothetical protein
MESRRGRMRGKDARDGRDFSVLHKQLLIEDKK